MKKTATIVLAILASIALFVTIVFTCVEWVAFDENRYEQAQQKYGIEAVTGMSAADLKMVTHELLSYCRGDRSDLYLQATINGQRREVFDTREKSHMADVQKLFVKGFKIRTVLIIAFLFLLLVMIYVARERTYRELAKGWIITTCVLGALLVALGIIFAIDFDAAFIQFHHMFFSNDLWQLYPYEVLIQMLPEQFFLSLAQAIVISSAVSLAIVTAAAAVVMRVTKKMKNLPVPDLDDDLENRGE